jgi:hypothetical protein
MTEVIAESTEQSGDGRDVVGTCEPDRGHVRGLWKTSRSAG